LRQLGVDVRRISVVPDELELIAREVAAQSRDFDVVFTSGGVGPTHHDVTIEGVARAMGVPVVRHPRLVATLEGYYRGELNDAHLTMAATPEGAESRDPGYLEKALAELLRRLPVRAVVQVP